MATFYNIRTIKANSISHAWHKIENGQFNEKDKLSDSLLSPQQFKDAPFPNGFDSWMETHHEIVSAIARNPEDAGNRVTNTECMQGTGGLYELAKELTDKFESLYRNKEWGVNDDTQYFETLDEFLEEEFKND